MITEIDTMIKQGQAMSVYQGKEFVLKPENMPLLLELYQVLKAIDIKVNAVVPLLVKTGYNNGKPCTVQNLIRLYKRGKDPQRIVGEEGLFEVIELFLGFLKLAIKKGKFNVDHPVKGKKATEFIQKAIESAIS